MALQTSAESPAPVRQIAAAMSGWVARLGWVWVEGQISQLNLRQSTAFLTLRDSHSDISVAVTCRRSLIDSSPTPITQGLSVVVHARPRYYEPRGTLSLYVDTLRPVGVGELLARLEQRRRLLAAEGLFAAELKRALPSLPRRIGLVTARDSAAERDVLENGRRRWPGVEFAVTHTLMQGADCARQVMQAVAGLDADADVEVIVIARGGGSVEDLLPFSDEALIRAVHRATTPVVSAIGHEPDNPILDLVADMRASTPTDAAKRVVPDVVEEVRRIRQLRDRARRCLHSALDRESRGLSGLRQRPVLAAPLLVLDERRGGVLELRDRARRCLTHRLDRDADGVAHHLARARGLSPLATMQRGYAVASAGGHVLHSAAQVSPGDRLEVRLADGRVIAVAEQVTASRPDGAAREARSTTREGTGT